jgi:Txe/YoeB family toxin of toxin-antitoxin system
VAEGLTVFVSSHLLDEIEKTCHAAEPLRHEWAGWWSRRITQEHHLIYRVSGNGVEIAVCRFHYGK